MKKRVTPAHPGRLAREFPLDDLLPGWFFRVEEISAGFYRAEGRTVAGNRISLMGDDADALLERCRERAKELREGSPSATSPSGRAATAGRGRPPK